MQKTNAHGEASDLLSGLRPYTRLYTRGQSPGGRLTALKKIRAPLLCNILASVLHAASNQPEKGEPLSLRVQSLALSTY